MKEFIKNQTVTYNLMSFTAYKALLFFSMLTEGPKSADEIINFFLNHPYLHEKISSDTIRVYINSLKRIGCEIIRVRGEDKISRYVIADHPFNLKLDEEQIKSITKIYRLLVKNIDVKELYSLELFFEKIGAYIKNDDFVAEIKKISMLKDTDKSLLKTLIECCENKEQIVISYNSPASGVKNIEILADKLEINNGKIYLCGVGFEYKQYAKFVLNRIKELVMIKAEKTIPEIPNTIKVQYELKGIKPELDEYDKVLSKNKDVYLIERETSNAFLTRQKLLEYGSNCTVIAPKEFRDEFVQLLKDMKAEYYCG